MFQLLDIEYMHEHANSFAYPKPQTPCIYIIRNVTNVYLLHTAWACALLRAETKEDPQ